MSAVVLFSGGLDSTTAVAKAVADGHRAVHLLSIAYGSRHQESEGKAAARLFAFFPSVWPQTRYSLERYSIPELFKGGESSLMGSKEIPDTSYKDLTKEGPSDTVVPYRNANFISVATTIAIKGRYDSVYIAVHASDARGWAYPDCTPEFIGAQINAVYVGSFHAVRLMAPFMWMTKADVVSMGYKLRAPLTMTYSCYRGGEIHCGRCPTCIERHNAFVEAVGMDPTVYEVDVEHD
jgi:7-cyano-7-deazaguanine synthase